MFCCIKYVSYYLIVIYTFAATIFFVLESGTLPFEHKYGDRSQSKAQVGSSQHILHDRDKVVVCTVTMPAVMVRFSKGPGYLSLPKRPDQNSDSILSPIQCPQRPLQWGKEAGV